MALDFHRLDNSEYLFGLDDSKYSQLADIFKTYMHWTGISIDPYSDTQITTENQRALIKIIDEYINKTDLNQNKQKTVAILELRGLMIFFLDSNCDIKLIGD